MSLASTVRAIFSALLAENMPTRTVAMSSAVSVGLKQVAAVVEQITYEGLRL